MTRIPSHHDLIPLNNLYFQKPFPFIDGSRSNRVQFLYQIWNDRNAQREGTLSIFFFEKFVNVFWCFSSEYHTTSETEILQGLPVEFGEFLSDDKTIGLIAQATEFSQLKVSIRFQCYLQYFLLTYFPINYKTILLDPWGGDSWSGDTHCIRLCASD